MQLREERQSQYEKRPVSRRDLLRRVAAIGGIGAVGGYAALAAAHWPGSLRDPDGRRALPAEKPFTLPDYRVPPPPGAPAVGVGRGGDGRTRLRKALDALGGLAHYVQPGDVVLVKPNVAFDRSPNLGATTHPETLSALVELLRGECRAAEVRVADNPIESPADCFAKSGLERAAGRAGGRIYLPDPNAFRLLHTPGATLIGEWWFFERPFRGVDKVIGLAPAKDHNLCRASLGMKNWYGLLGGRRNQFHQNIHEIVSDLALMIRPTLTIVDGGRVLMENGPTGGDPSNVREGDALAVGIDPVALDAWAYRNLLQRTDDPPAYLARAQAKGAGQVAYAGRVREVT